MIGDLPPHLGDKKVDSTQGHPFPSVTYVEPTYHLHLSPKISPQAAHCESLALKSPQYHSLDHLVDQAIHDRYKDQWETFSSSKKRKIRKQVAHSLMQRPDQKSCLHIQKSLAEAQGLSQRVVECLQGIVNKYSLQKRLDLTPFSDLLFSHYQSTHFADLLVSRLHITFGSDSSLTPLKNEIFKEVMTIRKELQTWTDSTLTYIRPPASTDGHSYVDHNGKKITLSQTLPSSADRMHPDVQNARLNLDGRGHVIYSTGRIETERKAHQVIDQLIHQTLSSGQITENELILQADGSYLYPIVVDNLIGSSSVTPQERKYLLQEDETLRALDGKVKYGRLKDGRTVRLVLKPIHFSTHANYNLFLGQANGWSSTGSKLSEEISNKGLTSLKEICQQRSLPDAERKAIDFCLQELENCSNIQDRFIFRAFICEILKIPYHVHCHSSKDRTAIVVAIKKALHQWIGLEKWRTQGNFTITDPRQFFNNGLFREYSEAALFESLPLTDQGIGITGEFDGKLHSQNRGFDYKSFLLENSLPTFVLTDRHLYQASLAERILFAVSMSIAGLIGAVLYIAFSPIILLVLAIKFKGEAWEVAQYLFLCSTLFLVRSGFRQKWIDHSSSTLKERNFFRTHLKTELAPSLKRLFDKIHNLSSKAQKNLVQFVKTGDQKYLVAQEEYKDILRDVADHWLVLNRRLKAGESLPSCLKSILKAAPSSPTLLFQYLKNFSQEVMFDLIKRTPICWPADNSIDELVRNPPVDGMSEQFFKDISRTHYIVRGKNRSYDFPRSYKGDKISDLTTALQSLSAFQRESKIPYPVQEALTQKNALLYYVLAPIYSSIDPTLSMSYTFPKERIYLIEEGSDSFFYLTLKEKMVMRVNEGDSSVISSTYSCTFKIAKIDELTWSTSLVALSPLQHKIEDEISPLLKASSCLGNVSTQFLTSTLSTLLSHFSYNFEAIAAWTEKSLISLETFRKHIAQQLSILSTTFASQAFQDKNIDRYLVYIEKSFREAQTQEGAQLILQALVSYLKFLKEEQRIKILVTNRTSHQLLKALSQEKELYSKILKSVLSPKNYQAACVQLDLTPQAEVYPTLDGHYPEGRFSKKMKYRHFFDHFIELLQSDLWKQRFQAVSAAPDSEMKKQCLQLQRILREPTQFRNAREQYQAFIKTLRLAIDLSQNGNSDPACATWVYQLAYERFAGVRLYDYCLGLVESVSGSFKEPITLDNFWEQFQQRNQLIKKPPKEGFSWSDTADDSLAEELWNSKSYNNLPYLYGQLQQGERVITILRHEAFISASPLDLIKGLFKKVKGGLTFTSDYLAFKETAKDQGQNILHIVLENADWTFIKDESQHVQARLQLESPNFIPVAFRMDGAFVSPSKYAPCDIEDFKKRFLGQLMGSFDTTGFSIPKRLKDAYGTKEEFEAFLQQTLAKIQALYFNKQEKLQTREEYQAFIFLTYAELTLSFCEQLEIDLLEAHCKLDIDRGAAFKAILVLHYLYLTQQLTPQKLQELMVNILAAPLIVKHQPILAWRGVFIQNVLQVVKKAFHANPNPAGSYEGSFNVLKG